MRGTLAPSIDNTQPWRFALCDESVEVRSDVERALSTGDARGRQLTISCGCALFNVRVSLAYNKCPVVLSRSIGDVEPVSGLAVVTSDAPETVDDDRITLLDSQIRNRHTPRGAFYDGRVPDAVAVDLAAAAAAEGAYLARASDLTDPFDGVERDTDVAGTMFVLASPGDNRESWFRVGEALERVLLVCTQLGYSARPWAAVIEHSAARETLQRSVRPSLYPHVALRIGRAAVTSPTRRRRLVDMFDELSES